jgi:cell division protein FtsB
MNILNIFPDKDNNEKVKEKDMIEPSPSLKQGKRFKKYQHKIEDSLEKKAEILSGIEGFSDMNDDSLANQTRQVINSNDYSNQEKVIDNLKKEYDKTLQEYNDLSKKISGDVTDYVNRVSPKNPYLNKTVTFTTGHVCYVTNQGVVKYITSPRVWNSVKAPKTNIIRLNIPWKQSYFTPGTLIPTTPPLISGTNVKFGQSLGNEGSNVFVDQLLPPLPDPKYMGCFASNDNNDNMEFIGEKPPILTNISIQNGNFSEPVINKNSFKYITGSSVPGWYFEGAILVNNSSAWGYPMPYPNGNQCVSIQNRGAINTVVSLNSGVTYTLTLKACGRNCCRGTTTSNPINIELYTNVNAFITQIANFTSEINSWKTYSFKFTVPTSQSYKLYFKGTNAQGDRSTALTGITLDLEASTPGKYSYQSCKQAAITNGYRYFGLQNVNTSSRLGYCAVSNSEPAIVQYGTALTVSKLVPIWSSNTAGQPGNTAVLSDTGSIQVLNSSGKALYSSKAKGANSTFIGCYQDKPNRAMTNTSNGQYLTFDECDKLAKDGGYKYIATQNASNGKGWCAASNDLNESTKYGVASNCSTQNNITMGGPWSNAIYSVEPGGNYFLILQEDGDMCIYRGANPNDNQGKIWCTKTAGKQRDANPNVIASKGKYGQNWMSSGSTLAPGDFIGSNDGKIALVMQTDGNLVLYAYQMTTNCQKIGNKTGGGVGANAVYDIGMTAVDKNIGQLGFIDGNADLYTYPSSNQKYSDNYNKIQNIDAFGNDIPGAFRGATVDSCKKACNSNPNCAGFVMNGDVCFPKNSGMYPFGGKGNFNSGIDTYIKGKQPSSPPNGVTENTINTNTVDYQNYINKGTVGNEYGLPSVTSVQKQQLAQLQTKMDMLSKQITDLTDKFQSGTIDTGNQSNQNVSTMHGYNNDLGTINSKIGTLAGVTTEGIEGMTTREIQNILKDSDIVVLQKNYEYLFWSILAAGTVLVSMNVVKNQ